MKKIRKDGKNRLLMDDRLLVNVDWAERSIDFRVTVLLAEEVMAGLLFHW